MKSCITFFFVTFAFLYGSAIADSPKFAGDPDEVQIKIEFRGIDTPNGIIFQSLARRIVTGYQSDPDRTIKKVRREIGIENDREAREFIELVDTEFERLSKDTLHAKRAYFCGARPDRSRNELFSDLDTLSGVEIDLAAASYDRFSASLDSAYASRLDSWIEKTKSGFQYYVPSAEQITDKMGVDAVAHYNERCVEIKRRLEDQQ